MPDQPPDIYPQLIINWGPPLSVPTTNVDSNTGVLSDTSYIDTTTNLKDVIMHALEYSKSIDILVGFFYFSGFLKLHKNLKDKRIRILVGIDLQKALKDLVTSVVEEDKVFESSQLQQYEAFKEHIRRLFNTTYFENPENKKAFDIFLQKLSDGTLEVRKTLDPVHAKVYLFHFDNQQYQRGIVITGSSNLTQMGLENNYEVNVLLKDDRAIEKANLYFTTLWESSEPLLNRNTVQEFKRFLSQKTWYHYPITPYKAFLKAVYEYFKTLNPERFRVDPSAYGYKPLSWQLDALWQAVRALDTHGGVLIGDVVGLGKSIIASLIAKYYSQTSLKHFVPIVICPPVLMPQWKEYLKDFGLLNNNVFSNSIQGISQARETTENLSPAEYEILFIIDEAHSIRNAESKTYQELYDTVFGNKVILLTATPYNNRPSEVINLLKLFQIPDAPTLPYKDSLNLLAHSLDKQFEEAKTAESEEKRKILTTNIRNRLSRIIDPVLIRRTRADLKIITRYKQDITRHRNITIPEVKGPYLLELTELGDIKPLIEQTIDNLLTPIRTPGSLNKAHQKQPGFKGTIYMPTQYIQPAHLSKYQKQIEEYFKMRYKNVQHIQFQNAHLIKRLLLFRFESSAFAFIRTLARLVIRHNLLYEFIKRHNAIPINKQINSIDYDILSLDESDIQTLQILLNNPEAQNDENNILLIPTQHLQRRFLQDIEEDIRTLTTIYNSWIQTWGSDLTADKLSRDILDDTDEFYNAVAIPFEKDPKLRELTRLIDKWFTNRQKAPNQYGKLVIFSEFTDTNFYIHKALSELMPQSKALLFSATNRTPKNLEILKANFDANYRGNLKLTDENTYDILLSTDVLSEGINLHQANGIINIDIPYNPSRVVQRIGRINRITGMKYNTIYIYNYFPTYISEQHIKVKNITTLKQEVAILLFGADTPILTQAEIDTIAEYQARRFVKRYKDAFREFLHQELEEESWDTRYLNIYFNTVLPNHKLCQELENMPLRIKLRRKDLPQHLKQAISNNKTCNISDTTENNQKDTTQTTDIFLTFIKEGNNIEFYCSEVTYGNNQDSSYHIRQTYPLTPNEAFKRLEANPSEKAYVIPDDKLPITRDIVQEIRESTRKSAYQRQGLQGTRKQAYATISKLLQALQSDEDSNYAEYINYLKKLLTLIADKGIFTNTKLKVLTTYFNTAHSDITPDEALRITKDIQTEFPTMLINRIYERIRILQNQETRIIVSELLEP